MKVQSTLLAVSSLLSLASALPAVKRDSSINEPAVIAPNGTPITLTADSAPTGFDNSNSNSGSQCMSGDCNTTTSSSNSCSSGNCDTSSSMMMESTSTMMAESSMMTEANTGSSNTWATNTWATNTWTSAAAANTYMTSADSNTWNTYMTSADSNTWNTWMTTADATNTWTTSAAAATYGSGYMPSGYDSCVQQCINSYGPPPSMATATASMPSYNNGASGTGATHTVIVAPTQGVLRYVPFAVNASVGDTVRFVWGAGPHTVTKSSELTLCNATMDAPFKSGMQNKSFVFDQVVNDTNPVYYYCGVPGHCEKGMFGIINPPNAQPGSQDTAQAQMGAWAQNSSDVAAQWSYTMMNTDNNTAASTWGMNMDITKITNDPLAQLALLQNVMFTRLAMASNSKFITSEGGFNPNLSSGMAIPMDPAKLTAANGTSSNPTSGNGNAASAPSGSSSSSAPSASSSTSGAHRTVASSATAIVAAVVIAALAL